MYKSLCEELHEVRLAIGCTKGIQCRHAQRDMTIGSESKLLRTVLRAVWYNTPRVNDWHETTAVTSAFQHSSFVKPEACQLSNL